jgi:6-phosphogluconolactonase (cycloisomerase 2 family)
MFTINGGTLTSIGAPLTLSAQPFFLTVEPAGQHVYAVNQSPGTVQPLTINTSTGALSLGQAVATGTTPVAVTFAR